MYLDANPEPGPSPDGPALSWKKAEPVAQKPNRQHLTIADVCDDLDISRSTFYDWRAKR